MILQFSCAKAWRIADCSEELTSRAEADLCSGCSEGAATESGGHGRWLLRSFKLTDSVSSLHIAVVCFALLTLGDELPHHLPVQKKPFSLSCMGKYLLALQTSRCISMKEANGSVATSAWGQTPQGTGAGLLLFCCCGGNSSRKGERLELFGTRVAVEILL